MLNDSQQRPISIAANGSTSTLPPNFTLQQSQAAATPAKVIRIFEIFIVKLSFLRFHFHRESHPHPPLNENFGPYQPQRDRNLSLILRPFALVHFGQIFSMILIGQKIFEILLFIL